MIQVIQLVYNIQTPLIKELCVKSVKQDILKIQLLKLVINVVTIKILPYL